MNLIQTLSILTRRRLAYATLAIVSMIAFGAIGFHLIEGIGWIDSVYIATETVTTVGSAIFRRARRREEFLLSPLCFWASARFSTR